MHAPSYAKRDEPQDEHEAVQRLRAELRSVTNHLEELLNFGFPPKGRSKDDREAHDAWHEDLHVAVRLAYESLQQTEAFSDAQVVQQAPKREG